MGPEGIILVNPPITTLQQSLTHSAMCGNGETCKISCILICLSCLGIINLHELPKLSCVSLTIDIEEEILVTLWGWAE